MAAKPHLRRFIQTLAGGLGLLLVIVVASAVWTIAGSRPVLTGTLAVPGVSAPVVIDRDARGVPTITAATRQDLARGLGFLHGQERFFEMDLLRRAGAGELAALGTVGSLCAGRERWSCSAASRAVRIHAAAGGSGAVDGGG
jgi:penicillin amidase